MIGFPDGAHRVFAAGLEVSEQDAWRYLQAGISWLGWEEDLETSEAYLGTVTETEPPTARHRPLPMAIGFPGTFRPAVATAGKATLISEAGGHAPMLDVTATAQGLAEAILALSSEFPNVETGGPAAAIVGLWLSQPRLAPRQEHLLDHWEDGATVPLTRVEIWRLA